MTQVDTNFLDSFQPLTYPLIFNGSGSDCRIQPNWKQIEDFSLTKKRKNKNGKFRYCGILSWSVHFHHWRYRIYGQSTRRETPTMLPWCQDTVPFDETQGGKRYSYTIGRARQYQGTPFYTFLCKRIFSTTIAQFISIGIWQFATRFSGIDEQASADRWWHVAAQFGCLDFRYQDIER